MRKMKVYVAICLVALMVVGGMGGAIMSVQSSSNGIENSRGTRSIGNYTISDRDANIKVVVSDTGYFSVGTMDGRKLTYDYPEPWHGTYISINIGGTIYNCGEGDGISLNPYIQSNEALSDTEGMTTWNINGTIVKQIMTIYQVPGHINEGYVTASIDVENHNSQSENVQVRYYFDTQVNENDGAPFYVPGYGLVTAEREFSNQEINFTFFQDFDDYANPSIVGEFSFSEDKPYKMMLASWPNSKTHAWDYTVTPDMNFTSDSAAMFYYDLGTIISGSDKSVDIGYGLGSMGVSTNNNYTFRVDKISTDREIYQSGDCMHIKVYGGNTYPYRQNGTLSIDIYPPASELPIWHRYPINISCDGGDVSTPELFTDSPSIWLQDPVTGIYTITSSLYASNGTFINSVSKQVMVAPYIISVAYNPVNATTKDDIIFTVSSIGINISSTNLYLDGTLIHSWGSAGTYNVDVGHLSPGEHNFNVSCRYTNDVVVNYPKGRTLTFLVKDNIVHSNFTKWNVLRDTYSIKNPTTQFSDGGFCYGVSSTEILYFKHNVLNNESAPSIPFQTGGNGDLVNKTYDLSLFPSYTSVMTNSGSQQNYALNNASLSMTAHQLWDPKAHSLLLGSQKHQYELLNQSLSDGIPVIVGLGKGVAGHIDKHAVVAFGIEIDSTKTAYIYISDPNYPREVRIATYYLENNSFKYGDYSKFITLSPEDIQINWFPALLNNYPLVEYVAPNWWKWWEDYTFIVAYKNAVINTSDGKTDYFTQRGNSQTFQCGIHGSSGITEGDIEVFAIPKGIRFTVDPPTSGSSFLYTFTVENTTDGAETYGYLLNMSSNSSYNYNVVIDNLTHGLVVEPSNSSINLDLTLMHTDADGHYYVLNATEIPISESDKAGILVKDWQSLNSTDTPSLEVGMYKQGDANPYATYGIANGDVGLAKNDKGPHSAFSFDIFWIIILLGIVTSLFLISFVLSKKRETEILPFHIEDEEETEVSKNKAPVPIETAHIPEKISLILPGNKILPLSSKNGKIKIGRVMLYKYLPKEMKEEIFNISREHCDIWNENGAWYVEDKGSTNGTKLNGKDIRGMGPTPLNEGDELVLANVLRMEIRI